MMFLRYKASDTTLSVSNENNKATAIEKCLNVSGTDAFIDSSGIHFRTRKKTSGAKTSLYRYRTNASGPGKYLINEILPAAGDVSASTAVSSTTFGTTDTVDVLGCNAAEEGGTGHDLDASHFPQVFLAYEIQKNADGTKVVGFDSEQWESCPASGAPSPSDGGAGASYALIGI